MSIEELKKEYEIQDNRYTAYPIYVTVQELVSVGVIKEGYSVNCPYGDGETITEFRAEDAHGFKTRQDAEKYLKEIYEGCTGGALEAALAEIEELNIGYIWTDIEFFLTIKGAEEYMNANKHNHGKLRTYVRHFERRNFEMRELLNELGFKNT